VLLTIRVWFSLNLSCQYLPALPFINCNNALLTPCQVHVNGSMSEGQVEELRSWRHARDCSVAQNMACGDAMMTGQQHQQATVRGQHALESTMLLV